MSYKHLDIFVLMWKNNLPLTITKLNINLYRNILSDLKKDFLSFLENLP